MTSTVWHTGTELFAPPKPNLANEKLQRLREQLEEKRLEMETREAEIRLNRLEHVRNRSERLARLVEGPVTPVPASSPTPRSLTESVNNTDYALTAYADLINRFTDSGIAPYPLTSIADRRWGHNWPFWRSENELAIWRARGRLLCGMSANAQGLQNGLDSYIIGKGFKWEFKPKKGSVIDKGIVEQGQRLLDDFLEKNRWSQFERESRNRGGEDGEVFIRMFPNTDGTMSVRFIEPEQVRDLSRHGVDGTYGIVTKPDDINEVVSYSVSYVAPGGSAKEGDDEDVPAADIVHIKRNVKSGVKRGLTDFSFGTADAFENASKLLRNMGLGAAVQAAIAGIRQHDVATSAQVDTFLAVDTAYQQQNPGTGQTDSYQVLDAGSFLDIPKGQNYVPPPGAANGPAHLSIQQALLRTAGARYNAPEWLCSGDASNGNYASSLTAESPFVKSCESEQHFYGKHFKLVITAFTLNAVKAGLIPDYFLDLVDVTYTPPRVQTRNAAEEATTSDVYLRNKVTSPQIVAAQQGLEWDQVEADWEEYEERFGAAPSPLPGMDDGSDGEPGDDDGEDKPTPPKPPKKPAPITEAKKPKHDPKTGQFTGDGRSDEEHPKHTVALPKNKKTLSLGATHEAMKQMGYGLGDSNYDPKTKQMTYDVKLPNGETKKVSTDDLKALIYKHAKLKESRQSRRKIPERWVTIGAKKSKDGGPKKGGTPVELDSRGKIVKGPSKMVGKKPHQLDVAYGTPGAPKADKEDIRKKANQLIGQKKRGELHQMLGTLGHRELKSLAKEHGLRTPGGKKELVRSIAAQMTTDYHGKRKVHKDARAANVHPQAVEDRAREIHALNMETHKLEKSVRSEVAKQYAAYNGKRMPSYKELQGKDIESLKSYDVIVDSLRKAPETKRFFAGLNREESEQKVMDLISNKPSPAPSRTSAREEALQQLQDNPDAAYWRKGRAKAATSHDDGFTPFSDQF